MKLLDLLIPVEGIAALLEANMCLIFIFSTACPNWWLLLAANSMKYTAQSLQGCVALTPVAAQSGY